MSLMVTMKNIAEKAGVSRFTVSEVLNNRPTFASQATKDKVLKIARELNYRPNYFAASLKKGRTQCVGLMGSMTIVNFRYPFFTDLTAGVEKTIRDAQDDYGLIIFGANDNEPAGKTMDFIKKGLVDGIIIILLSQDLDRFEKFVLPELREYRIPFVIIHSTARMLPYNNVGLDGEYGGYLAGRHLCGLGYEDMGYYSIFERTPLVREMLGGFKRALAENGLCVKNENIIEHRKDASASDLFDEACRCIMKSGHIPRALFVPTDQAAYGIITGLRDKGLRVPEDVAVAASDEAAPVSFFKRELTSTCNRIPERAAAAVHLLYDILAGRKDPEENHQVIVKPYLDVKTTCGSK